jgi:hypothetical protein
MNICSINLVSQGYVVYLLIYDFAIYNKNHVWSWRLKETNLKDTVELKKKYRGLSCKREIYSADWCLGNVVDLFGTYLVQVSARTLTKVFVVFLNFSGQILA